MEDPILGFKVEPAEDIVKDDYVFPGINCPC